MQDFVGGMIIIKRIGRVRPNRSSKAKPSRVEWSGVEGRGKRVGSSNSRANFNYFSR